MERGRIQGLPKFFWYPLLSQELVKLRTSNFVGTFIGLIGTKAHENVGSSAPTIFRDSGDFNEAAGEREMAPKCGSLPRDAGDLAGLLWQYVLRYLLLR